MGAPADGSDRIGLTDYILGAVVSTYVVGQFVFLRLMMSAAGGARRGPLASAYGYSAALTLGHLVQVALFFALILVGLVLWRSQPIRRPQAVAVARGIAVGHWPLLVWLILAIVMWLPVTLQAARQGISTDAIIRNSSWAAIGLVVLAFKQAAQLLSVLVTTVYVSRKLTLGVVGALVAVFLPCCLAIALPWIWVLLK